MSEVYAPDYLRKCEDKQLHLIADMIEQNLTKLQELQKVERINNALLSCPNCGEARVISANQIKETEALKSELSAKDERVKELEKALDRFCTLSNGLSIYARDEYQRTRLEMTDSVDLVERIDTIYNHQCDVEHLTQQHTTKGAE
jgi:hypothetical protein